MMRKNYEFYHEKFIIPGSLRNRRQKRQIRLFWCFLYKILNKFQVRKLAASRDIQCTDCGGKGGSNVKTCQVNSKWRHVQQDPYNYGTGRRLLYSSSDLNMKHINCLVNSIVVVLFHSYMGHVVNSWMHFLGVQIMKC